MVSDAGGPSVPDGALVFVGIDPGLEGALAVLPQGLIFDVPTVLETSTAGRRQREYLPREMFLLLANLEAQYPGRVSAALEHVAAIPEMGRVSAFRFGFGFGLWEMALAAAGIPYTKVRPATWKSAVLAGLGRDKAAARRRAQQLFPQAEALLRRVGDHNRAEALLLALWLSHQNYSQNPD